MIRIVFAVAAIAAGLTIAVAQDPVAARRAVMKEFGKNHYGAVLPVSQGRQPFDQAKIDAAFAGLEETVKRLPGAFPAGSDKGPDAGSDYYLKQGALDNRADIDAKIANMQKAIADNKVKAKDADSTKAAYTAVNDTCNSCHTTYRLKKS